MGSVLGVGQGSKADVGCGRGLGNVVIVIVNNSMGWNVTELLLLKRWLLCGCWKRKKL